VIVFLIFTPAVLQQSFVFCTYSVHVYAYHSPDVQAGVTPYMYTNTNLSTAGHRK